MVRNTVTTWIDWKVETDDVKLGVGSCADYAGMADFIMGDLYGPLPDHLRMTPMIINAFNSRTRQQIEKLAGCELTPIGKWGKTMRNVVYVGNRFPVAINLTDLEEDEVWGPGCGTFPLELPMRLLPIHAPAGGIVFDPAMGRGTAGKAALFLGMKYVGVDINPDRVEMAREYLGC